MPNTASDAAFQAMPEFATFRNIVTENIGYVPRIMFDHFSLAGHRVRIFREPPGVDVHYSQRSLARYIELADIFFAAMDRKSPEVLAAGLMVVRGSDALRQDKFGGLALLARGFMQVVFDKLPYQQIISNAIEQGSADLGKRTFSLTSLFLPLAHEIGHVPEAQAIGPAALHTDEILETYRINQLRIMRFTGTFDYSSSLTDLKSRLNLTTLREEAVSDYFGVSAICGLMARMSRAGMPYPLYELTTALLSFPLIMAIQSICLAGPQSHREIQELTLAMHCRYSLIVDSVRYALKGLFKNRTDRNEVYLTIDDCVDDTHRAFEKLYEMAWKAVVLFCEELDRVAQLDNAGILSCLAEAKADVRRQLALAKYLDVIAADIEGYSVNSTNLHELRQYGTILSTFDTVILENNSIRLIR